MADSAFAGFRPAALDFYEDLEDDNTRTFWQEHRELYEREVRAPMTALAAALAGEFGTAKVFRPYRDLRYSKDKTPYKTHQGAYVAVDASTGYYVQIDAAGLRVGAGWYHAEPSDRARFRAAVDEDTSGAALERLLGRLERGGYDRGGDRLKTRPRGWDADHVRIDLLRHNTLWVGRRHDGPDQLATPEVADLVRADWRTLTPLVRWHLRHVRTVRTGDPPTR